MFRLYKLLFLMLVSGNAYVSGMEEDPRRNSYNQTREPICQTGAIETVIRDAFCGGLIKPSVMGAIMAVALANHHDAPCRRYVKDGTVSLGCVWQGVIGFYCIAFPFLLKWGGYVFDVTNNHPTKRAELWRDGCRALYGMSVMCAMLYSDYLFEKIIVF